MARPNFIWEQFTGSDFRKVGNNQLLEYRTGQKQPSKGWKSRISQDFQLFDIAPGQGSCSTGTNIALVHILFSERMVYTDMFSFRQNVLSQRRFVFPANLLFLAVGMSG